MSLTQKPIRYFFNIADKVYYINDTDNETKLHVENTVDKEYMKYNYFEAFQGYEPTLESLIQYRKDLNEWADEIKDDVNYRYYYNHSSAILSVFKSKSTFILNKLKVHKINFREMPYIEGCYNAGLMSINKDIINKQINCFGYDFSAFYANLLAKCELEIPIRQGTETKTTSLKFPLEYGIYKVEIKSKHPDFHKLFSFSSDNYYTHYSLEFCKEHQEKFKIEMNLINNDKDEFNSIVWSKEKLVKSNRIFGTWFNYLVKLKERFPKNKLVKCLMSQIWGTICQFQREILEKDEYSVLDISLFTSKEKTEYKLLNEVFFMKDGKLQSKYEVIKSDQPYKHDLARLKPFLTSYGRCKTANLIISENLVKNVVRIHTDGICLNKEHDFTHLKYYPKPEAKTTGLLIFKHVNKYFDMNAMIINFSLKVAVKMLIDIINDY